MTYTRDVLDNSGLVCGDFNFLIRNILRQIFYNIKYIKIMQYYCTWPLPMIIQFYILILRYVFFFA